MEKEKLTQAKEILKEQLEIARKEYTEIESTLEKIWDKKIIMTKEEQRELVRKQGYFNKVITSIPSMLSNLEFLTTGNYISSFDF